MKTLKSPSTQSSTVNFAFLAMDDLSQAVSDKLQISPETSSTSSLSPTATGPSVPRVKPDAPDPASIPTIVPAERELWFHMFPADRKMMKGTITATAPLPSHGSSKVTYETHPHIIEQLLSYVSANTLLAFRATCRRLRDRADMVFQSHIELHMEGMSLIFETPGKRVITAQRTVFLLSTAHPVRTSVSMSGRTRRTCTCS